MNYLLNIAATIIIHCCYCCDEVSLSFVTLTINITVFPFCGSFFVVCRAGEGVYFGWASLEAASPHEEGTVKVEGPWKCVANVGYSPTFAGQENAEKIVEGHLIGYEGAAGGGRGQADTMKDLVVSVTYFSMLKKTMPMQ